MYYVYLYLREDRTPYYVGKGIDQRAFKQHIRGGGDIRPDDKDRIKIIKYFDVEEDAYEFEKWLIALYGRKSDGGILINIKDGGIIGGGSSLSLDIEERKKYKREYMKEYNKKYYHENPEKVKGWRDKRIERRRETERAWRAKNKERLNARKREQYWKKKLESADKECYDI
jgi:hypothetical protein